MASYIKPREIIRNGAPPPDKAFYENNFEPWGHWEKEDFYRGFEININDYEKVENCIEEYLKEGDLYMKTKPGTIEAEYLFDPIYRRLRKEFKFLTKDTTEDFRDIPTIWTEKALRAWISTRASWMKSHKEQVRGELPTPKKRYALNPDTPKKKGRKNPLPYYRDLQLKVVRVLTGENGEDIESEADGDVLRLALTEFETGASVVDKDKDIVLEDHVKLSVLIKHLKDEIKYAVRRECLAYWGRGIGGRMTCIIVKNDVGLRAALQTLRSDGGAEIEELKMVVQALST
jgi:hypothetical protein